MLNKNSTFYYDSDFNKLEMYQQLIQYWSILFEGRKDVNILDNMNFNLEVFPEAIKINELIDLHKIEPGYMSPDGHTEMCDLIKDLEYERLIRKGDVGLEKKRKLVEEAGIGCGNGCTTILALTTIPSLCNTALIFLEP